MTLAERRVKGLVDVARCALRAVGSDKVAIAGDGRRLAQSRDGIEERRVAVAVDDQAGDAGCHQRRIEAARQAARHPERAGVPGDVAVKVLVGQAKVRETSRTCIGGMLADDHHAP